MASQASPPTRASLPPRPALIPASYTTYTTPDPHEDHTGPFWFDRSTRRSAFVVSERAVNSNGVTHGGALLTFADFSLFVVALEYTGTDEGGYVTISLSSEIVAASREGDLVESEGEVIRATRDKDLIFVRVRVFSGARTLLTAQGIIKYVAPRTPRPASPSAAIRPAPARGVEEAGVPKRSQGLQGAKGVCCTCAAGGTATGKGCRTYTWKRSAAACVVAPETDTRTETGAAVVGAGLKMGTGTGRGGQVVRGCRVRGEPPRRAEEGTTTANGGLLVLQSCL